MDKEERTEERKSQKSWFPRLNWRPSVQIKKGMLVRCKAKISFFAFATTDEYQNEDLFRQQEDYWKDYWKDSGHPPGHTLKRRRTLVDVVHVRFVKGGIKLISKKTYIYPREQLSPLSQTETERLYALLEQESQPLAAEADNE